MFGVRFSSLFRSRWMALGWAVMMCLSAIGFVGTPDAQQAPEDAALNEAMAALD